MFSNIIKEYNWNPYLRWLEIMHNCILTTLEQQVLQFCVWPPFWTCFNLEQVWISTISALNYWNRKSGGDLSIGCVQPQWYCQWHRSGDSNILLVTRWRKEGRNADAKPSFWRVGHKLSMLSIVLLAVLKFQNVNGQYEIQLKR